MDDDLVVDDERHITDAVGIDVEVTTLSALSGNSPATPESAETWVETSEMLDSELTKNSRSGPRLRASLQNALGRFGRVGD